MRRRQYGITAFFLAVVIAAAALGGAVVERTIAAALDRAGADAVLRRTVMQDVTWALLALGAFLTGLAIVAGRALSDALRAVRAALLARARGDVTPLPVFAVRELAELCSAAERLLVRVSTRETELEREGEDVSVLLDAISEGILQLDGAGRVVRTNPAARALLRIGERPGQPIATEIRHVELRRILEVAASGKPVEAAEIGVDDRRIIVSARPIRDPAHAERGGAVVAFLDLTEVRRLEGVRRDFVANVSHELKTPLTSIRGYVETLLGDDDVPLEMRRQFLEVVQKNAQRLSRIIDELLDLSRLESGGWRPELHEIDATAIVQDVWTSCSERAERRGVIFRAPAAETNVIADPGGFRQVMSNLLDNALRYTPQGGRIEVSATQSQTGYVTFEVRDNGAGIPSDALPRIFERFYRADPARSRAEGGTGLGLSIVRHLVERMGGDVSAESELGKGTTIRFNLPAAS